jgi:hypothetical protein
VSYASVAPAVLAVGALLALGRRDLTSWRDRAAALLVLVALAVALAVAAGSAIGTDGVPHPGVLSPHAVRWALAAGAVFLTWLFCLMVVAAIVRVTLAAWPKRVDFRRSDGGRAWLAAAVLLLVSVSAAQWTWAAHARATTVVRGAAKLQYGGSSSRPTFASCP